MNHRNRNQRCVFTRVVGDLESKSKSVQTVNPKTSVDQSTITTSTVQSRMILTDRETMVNEWQTKPRTNLGNKKKVSFTATLVTVPVSKPVTRKKISRNEFRSSSHWNKVYLDHPEVIKDKAKRLVTELEKKRIILNESSIERIIRGDPKEYIGTIKKIFTAYGSILNLHWENTCRNRNVNDELAKLDGKTSDGVAALFGILTHILNFKPALNPVQFMQNRYTIQKLILCNEIIQRLSNYRPPIQT